jgi:hypothetical protein
MPSNHRARAIEALDRTFPGVEPEYHRGRRGGNLMMTGGVIDETRIPARCTLERPLR